MIHNKRGWIVEFRKRGLMESDEFMSLYVMAYYFIIQTISSLGFGDIMPSATIEYLFCMLMQMLTIIFFSYMLGSSYLNIDKDYRLRDQSDLLQEKVDFWLITLNQAR